MTETINLPYARYDVFTDRQFGGNPLAVFPDCPADLKKEEMQAIANEMNLSETVFLFPSDQADVRLRIFTPDRELPLAGHPTVGAGWHFAHQKGFTKSAAFKAELGVGVIELRVECEDGKIRAVSMDQTKPEIEEVDAGLEEILAAVGLQGKTNAAALPLKKVSTGIPFIMLALENKSLVDEAGPRLPQLDQLLEKTETIGVYLFALESNTAPAQLYSRMFCHIGTIMEDPATGSASGCVAAYLASLQAVERKAGEPYRFTSVQGVAMGRPSLVQMEADVNEAGDPAAVRVAGGCAFVAEGELILIREYIN